MDTQSPARRPVAVPKSESREAPSRALSKGIEIVELLSGAESPVSLRAIAEAIGLGKPSTLRLLQTLVSAGVVETKGDGNYMPRRRFTTPQGPTWVDEVIEAAREDMERLSAELAEAVTLAALYDDHIRVVSTIESRSEIRMSNYLSRILSPYASSLGKAIAAYQTPDCFHQLLQVYGVYRFTPKTITEPGMIREEMARTRERGYSEEFEETVSGGCCFGAPIRVEERVRASVSISLPVARFTPALESTLGDCVRVAAERIEKRLAGSKRRAMKLPKP
jgi:IclR family acetate operon transcriptional repressor